MPIPRATCRFAPSPNGPLHLGHAYSAWRNASVATRLTGRLLLRMDDIDVVRCPPALEAAALDDLAWLGFRWEHPVRRQSEHVADYRVALGRLGARALLYPCFCTRGEIGHVVASRATWPRDPDGAPLYPGTCRTLSPTERDRRLRGGEPHALRLDMAGALEAIGATALDWVEHGEGEAAHRVVAHPAAWGDAVLRRKDIPASYHVAVVVDDAAQGVTDVVRGVDLFAATSLHRLLQTLLELPAPRYHHHRLVVDATGEKLAKSRGAPALRDLRRAGTAPSDLAALIATRLSPHGSSVVSQYR